MIFIFCLFGQNDCFNPFDGSEYSKVVKYLVIKGLINRDQIVDAVEVTDEQLLRVHTKGYLDALNNHSATMTHIAAVPPISYLPNKYVFNRLVKPMRLATGGTVQAMHLRDNMAGQ